MQHPPCGAAFSSLCTWNRCSCHSDFTHGWISLSFAKSWSKIIHQACTTEDKGKKVHAHNHCQYFRFGLSAFKLFSVRRASEQNLDRILFINKIVSYAFLSIGNESERETSTPPSAHLIMTHSVWGAMRWDVTVREGDVLLSSFLSHFLLKLTLKFHWPLILITFDSSGMRMSAWKIGKQMKRERGRENEWRHMGWLSLMLT